jgi:hypothetical protein
MEGKVNTESVQLIKQGYKIMDNSLQRNIEDAFNSMLRTDYRGGSVCLDSFFFF